jgi:peptidoglycan biosynthesis protein MviN/MurJ (putative lipid II flippase)
MNYVKAFGLWLGFLAVAISCALIREKYLVPELGPVGGKALGTLLVGVIIFGLMYAYVGKLKGTTKASLFKLGLFWTMATVAFEFLFGHYVMRHSWDALWADYNIFQGRLWPLVLMVTLFGPLLAQEIRD